MRRIKVLYLPAPPDMAPCWDRDVIDALRDRHDVHVYDPALPMHQQFEGCQVVIEHGSVGTAAMIEAAGDAKLWQVHGTGVDHLDLEVFNARGLAVANCPGQHSAAALAECAMMFLLMLARSYQKCRTDFHRNFTREAVAMELSGRNLLIIGLGASGQQLASRAKPFGLRIAAVDVRPFDQTLMDDLGVGELAKPDGLDRLLADADFVSLHLHLNSKTRHIIDSRRLGLMKRTACLINVSRGGLVDEAALHERLNAGKLGGAGLDVFETEPTRTDLPVYQLDNVFTSPHLAGTTDLVSRRRSVFCGHNVDRIASGLGPENIVNDPTTGINCRR